MTPRQQCSRACDCQQGCPQPPSCLVAHSARLLTSLQRSLKEHLPLRSHCR
jgi:hypothetical protein